MVKISVFDITGKIIEEFNAAPNQTKSFGETYPKGLYFVNLVTKNGEVKNIKVVKN
jgi:hypothetical protein